MQEFRDIAIVVTVYNESYRQIYESLSRIFANLPSAQVCVLLNGPYRSDVSALTTRFHFKLVTAENFANNDTWFLWWSGMLKFFAASGAKVCFKFDPDTMVDASPTSIPSDDYFGSVIRGGFRNVTFIQGGVTGLSSDAVQQLLAEKLLAPKNVHKWMAPVPAKLPLMDDQFIGEAMACLGIRPVPWPACRSQWKLPVLNNPITHAIVHPRYYR